MNTRECFQAIMNFEPVDRLPAIEAYWWWDLTLERWYAEGLPRELQDHRAVALHLGLDAHRLFWVTPASNLRRAPDRPREQGVIASADEYDERVAPAFPEAGIDPRFLELFAAEQESGDAFLWLQVDGFFWFPREILGIERHLLAFYDEPDLMHRINRDLAACNLRILEEICSVCVPDAVTFAEDISYNHGCMISKECFEEFLLPYYRQVVPEFVRRGIVPLIDSDGDISEMIPWLEDAGIVGASPLERRSGVDIARIRAEHPRFRMIGGFDKTVMHRGENAMRAEFERILPVMRSGGYIPSCDHQTPPDVSIDNYRTYVGLLREYTARGASSDSPEGTGS